ncbi:MAG: ATP phosphoribosyltransferase [Spirochaetia bacterium]|nr:ATP phosphoribosyltransferase [Spirochaetia bacterium]
MKDFITIALPKGRMSEESLSHFYQCGITKIKEFNHDRKLIFDDIEKKIKFLLVRSKDVGTYIEQGAADIGVIGFDLLKEHEFNVYISTKLPFGKCRLSVAWPQNHDEPNKRHIKVATKYPRITSKYFYEQGINIELINLYGSIEIAPLTGISHAIVDLVSTGETLKANNLIEKNRILNSEARLIFFMPLMFSKGSKLQIF